jgi:hypothetical protein
MTVFMGPPFNISLEVRQKFIEAHKYVFRLFLAPVPVISFPGFIVVPSRTFEPSVRGLHPRCKNRGREEPLCE